MRHHPSSTNTTESTRGNRRSTTSKFTPGQSSYPLVLHLSLSLLTITRRKNPNPISTALPLHNHVHTESHPVHLPKHHLHPLISVDPVLGPSHHPDQMEDDISHARLVGLMKGKKVIRGRGISVGVLVFHLIGLCCRLQNRRIGLRGIYRCLGMYQYGL